MADIVQLELTRDRFESEVLAESVRSQGFDVHLVNDIGDSGALTPASRSRLLVHREDLSAVQMIIEGAYPAEGHVSARRRFSPRVLNALRLLVIAVVAVWLYSVVGPIG